jgi:hypothetical protein
VSRGISKPSVPSQGMRSKLSDASSWNITFSLRKRDKESRGVKAKEKEENYGSDTRIEVRGRARPAQSSCH